MITNGRLWVHSFIFYITHICHYAFFYHYFFIVLLSGCVMLSVCMLMMSHALLLLWWVYIIHNCMSSSALFNQYNGGAQIYKPWIRLKHRFLNELLGGRISTSLMMNVMSDVIVCECFRLSHSKHELITWTEENPTCPAMSER